MLLYRTLTEFYWSFTKACDTLGHGARVVHARGGGGFLAPPNGLGPCWVRSGTDYPCDRPAVVEIMSVHFCGPHAREQEECFTVGQLAQAQDLVAEWERQARNLGNEPLVETLEAMQLEFALRFARAMRRIEAVKRGP